MANLVTGDQYRDLDGKLMEIKRQLRQRGGYPYSIAALDSALQFLIEGGFDGRHFVDCDARPFIPVGWSLVTHTMGGLIEWDADRVRLHLYVPDQVGGDASGYAILKVVERSSIRPLNANVLDFLLKPENQRLIPEEWKGDPVFFWGTLYRNSDDKLIVRCLHWNFAAQSWEWNAEPLDGSWGSGSHAATLLT